MSNKPPYTSTEKAECGLSYDFHGLRHTFATLLNIARVPLVTAQKLMRHSDPKLTTKIYTHVLVDTKAEAIDMLPTLSPALPTKIMDRPADSCGSDFNRRITTYSDAETAEKSLVFTAIGNTGNEKAPVSQGKTGALNTGTRSGIRTLDLLIKSERAEASNINVSNTLQCPQNAWTIQRTVHPDNHKMESCQASEITLFADLSAIVASWPSVPAPIREVVKAVLAPYMRT